MGLDTYDSPMAASYDITIDGLMRKSDYEVEDPELASTTVQLGGDELISRIWSKLEGKQCGSQCSL